MRTVYWRATDFEHKFISKFSWAASMYYPMLNKFFDTFFRGDFPNQGKDVYLNHLQEVRALVPSERLLEFNISEGWEPLCKFLGHDIPRAPFPQSNEISDFISRSRRRNRRQMMNIMLYILVVVAKAMGTASILYFSFQITRFWPRRFLNGVGGNTYISS